MTLLSRASNNLFNKLDVSRFEYRLKKCAASIPRDPLKFPETFLYTDFVGHINFGLTYDTVANTPGALSITVRGYRAFRLGR